MAAKAGKAIFCEKPIDLDINKVNECWTNIKKFKVPIQIGFNRRYDAGHSFVKKSVTAGKIGKLEMIVITSRDPAPPPLSYLKKSGGIFRDCSIHDFDLARFILQDDPIVEDATFDEVAKILLKNYDKIKHHHKELIRKDSLKAGTYLGVYPTIVKDTVEMVRKKYIC